MVLVDKKAQLPDNLGDAGQVRLLLSLAPKNFCIDPRFAVIQCFSIINASQGKAIPTVKQATSIFKELNFGGICKRADWQ
jgi:hypothetical protein